VLFAILNNEYFNEIRYAIRRADDVTIDHVEHLLSVPSNHGHRLILRDLDLALAQLPDEQREVVLLIGLEGMRYEDAGLALGIPIGTVRSRLSRARQWLREFIEGNLGTPAHATVASRPDPVASTLAQ
jgi:RNA polymerase sigma-70 factor (ECF subfamily)